MRVPWRPSRWRKVTSQTQLLRRKSSTIGFGWDSILEAERVLQVDMVNPKNVENKVKDNLCWDCLYNCLYITLRD